ncbi:hypothetical protein ACO1NJ_14760, partial [Staphylococcus aureus]
VTKLFSSVRSGMLVAGCLIASAAIAQENTAPDVKGVWIDHTGRGAVEIIDCGGRLCGSVVWLRDTKNVKACGVQIIGNVP